MAASSRGISAPPTPLPLSVRFKRVIGSSSFSPIPLSGPAEARWRRIGGCGGGGIRCCCPDTGVEMEEEWRRRPPEPKRRVRTRAMPAVPFPLGRSQGYSKQKDFYPRCSPKGSAPQSRDTPPKRDTGIASEKEWGINLLDENVKESGTNEDGSTWYRESGEDLGDNGYRCRWARMGGQSNDGSSKWKETWWEKSDWTGYKELGAEKSGKNADGDSWWETWQEVLYQDEWRYIIQNCMIHMKASSLPA
ncbi:uncharacterized protein M6B38_154030 [Iris pallida]|uniref:Uncharacterized protein n=1 Tax=Iris pallida TaxID=29817 RepID=A0AAX6F5C0_IRIPA|nr:uncharacterized protein M6B38_154030 [Iris pallida]